MSEWAECSRAEGLGAWIALLCLRRQWVQAICAGQACEICVERLLKRGACAAEIETDKPFTAGAELSTVVEGNSCMFEEELLGIPLNSAAATIQPHEIGCLRNGEINLRQIGGEVVDQVISVSS